jgi:hypothetical protein
MEKQSEQPPSPVLNYADIVSLYPSSLPYKTSVETIKGVIAYLTSLTQPSNAEKYILSTLKKRLSARKLYIKKKEAGTLTPKIKHYTDEEIEAFLSQYRNMMKTNKREVTLEMKGLYYKLYGIRKARLSRKRETSVPTMQNQ